MIPIYFFGCCVTVFRDESEAMDRYNTLAWIKLFCGSAKDQRLLRTFGDCCIKHVAYSISKFRIEISSERVYFRFSVSNYGSW